MVKENWEEQKNPIDVEKKSQNGKCKPTISIITFIINV